MVKPSGAHPTAANAVGRYKYILGSHPKCRIPSSRDRILDISTVTARWRLGCSRRPSEPGSQHQLMSLAVPQRRKSCRVQGGWDCGAHPLWSSPRRSVSGSWGPWHCSVAIKLPAANTRSKKRRAKTEKLRDAVRRCLAAALLPAHIGPEATRAVCRGKQHLVCKIMDWQPDFLLRPNLGS